MNLERRLEHLEKHAATLISDKNVRSWKGVCAELYNLLELRGWFVLTPLSGKAVLVEFISESDRNELLEAR